MFQALQEKRAIQNHLSRTSLCPKHDARFINVKLFDIHQNSICEEPRGSYYYNRLTEMFLCLELCDTETGSKSFITHINRIGGRRR